LSTSLSELAVKVIVALFQPVKPLLSLSRTAVDWVSLPKLTWNCSVVVPVSSVT
jgi:hypothetical protein